MAPGQRLKAPWLLSRFLAIWESRIRAAFASPAGLAAHHLYLCVRGGIAFANHVTIRDYLRRNSQAAAAYGPLKKQVAQRFPTDGESYLDGTTEFLLGVLGEAAWLEEALRAVDHANRMKE